MAMSISKEQAVAALIEHCNGDVAKAHKEIKKKSTIIKSELYDDMCALVKKYPKINFKTFKTIAATAWCNAHEEPVKKRALHGYNLFMQTEMPKIKADNPAMTKNERMAELSRRWNMQKNGSTDESERERDEQVEAQVDDAEPNEQAEDAEPMEQETIADEAQAEDAQANPKRKRAASTSDCAPKPKRTRASRV